MTWQQFTTCAELDALDDDLVVAGYRAGRKNDPDYTQTARDYWHGYVNGQIDGRHISWTDSHMKLPPDEFKKFYSQLALGAHH